jgi:hypothetical protein
MKKFKLLLTIFIALFCALNSQAQFTTDKDSSKGYWVSSAYPVEVHVKAINTSSAPVTIKWKMISNHFDAGWSLDGACDNVDCKTSSTPGLLDGTGNFSTFPITVGDNCDFKLGFNESGAASNTKAYAVLELTSTGGPTKNAVFIAYKNGAGITTATIQENEISIFPNPAQNYIDVLYSPFSDVNTIAIYNIIGKVVSVYKVTDKSSARCEFNADMPSGIYLVRIADSKGKVIATRKITRQ